MSQLILVGSLVTKNCNTPSFLGTVRTFDLTLCEQHDSKEQCFEKDVEIRCLWEEFYDQISRNI